MFIGQNWQNLRKDSSTTMAEVVVGERGTVVKSMVEFCSCCLWDAGDALYTRSL